MLYSCTHMTTVGVKGLKFYLAINFLELHRSANRQRKTRPRYNFTSKKVYKQASGSIMH